MMAPPQSHLRPGPQQICPPQTWLLRTFRPRICRGWRWTSWPAPLAIPPLHNRPDPPRRGLQLVGGRDLRAAPSALPLPSRIDRHLRLRLGGAANRVAVERLSGMRWQPLDLYGRRNGHGGVTLDLAALERLAGPVSPPLARVFRPGAAPVGPPAPPRIDKG